MAVLTDRQRIELALPAYLLYALTALPGVFVPAGPTLVTAAELDVCALRAELKVASLEPFADLVPQKRRAMLRRLERVTRGLVVEWTDRPALSLMLTLWHFLTDLTDRDVLHLWEGSAMDRAMRKLLPMFEHGFDEDGSDAAAQKQAHQLLARLQAEGFYR